MFEHVNIERSRQDGACMSLPAAPSSPDGKSVRCQAGSEGLHSPGGGALVERGPANAALKLLDDLCMMLTGQLPFACRSCAIHIANVPLMITTSSCPGDWSASHELVECLVSSLGRLPLNKSGVW